MAKFTEKRLQAERDRHESWLQQQPGFQGSGVGLNAAGKVSIKVYTSGMPPDVQESIRQKLNEVPVAFEETGEILPS